MSLEPPASDADSLRRPLWVRLAAQHGIAEGYHDIWGNYRVVPTEGLQALLAAIGVAPGDPDALNAALDAREAELAQALRAGGLAAATVLWSDQAPWTLSLQGDLAKAGLVWTLTEEQGVVHRGQTLSDGKLALPALPLGYHRLDIVEPGSSVPPLATSLLIHSPGRNYLPPAIEAGARLWGPALQLYALRSRHNWGVGDFSDLRRVLPVLARAGASMVGLNPLHALYPSRPGHASPYSPSSRCFGNVMAIDVTAVPEFTDCEDAQRWVADLSVQSRLQALRDAPLVDYPQVASLKFPVLERLYAHFQRQHLGRPADARARQYQAFIEAGGEALQHHARFEALQAHFQAQDPEVWGWPRWPRAYHDPRGEAVAAFAREHADRVGFYLYLQWQFDQQIEAVQASAQSLGMVIGLYKDLAVSIDSGGADAWTGQGLYAAAASAGCPPDDFNLNGQDWGLLPFIPQRLMQTQFAAFIQALRANMRAAGALRLDHVMGLSRLFWVPRGALGTAGAYVTYPFDHLLAIVTLESQRQRCMVIGEDLGTVPDTVRTGMQLSRTLAYRVLYFSRTSDGGFLRPGDFPVDALVTATTHDLATLQGYWEGRDIALRERLNLYPRAGMAQAQREAREHDRVKLVEALDREGLLPEACRDVWPLRMSPALVTAVYRYLARTPSHVLTVQPEDVLGVADQVNLPGTVDEYDNWRRKLPLDVDAWGSDGRWQALGDALAAEGRGGLS